MHNLIVGTTGSGKTTLCIRMSELFALDGIKSIVYDPFLNSDFQGSLYNDKENFLEDVFSCTGASIFVDEGGLTIGRDTEMLRLATQGRHYGHICNFICHRYSDVHKTLRGQCSTLYIFRSGAGDIKIMREEFIHINNEFIEQIPYLNNGECMIIPRYGIIRKINVFNIKVF